jgi:flagellar biogenesis protein FliO
MGQLLQALVALALVLGLVVLLGKVAGRRIGRVGAEAKSGPLRVVQRLPLGAKSFLLVVQGGDRRWLVGVGPEGFQTLAELDRVADEEVEVLDLRDAEDPAAALMATWGSGRESVPHALGRLLRGGRAVSSGR